MTIEEKINKLSNVALSLNQKTEEASAILIRYNDRLSKINIGVSVTLDDKIAATYDKDGSLHAYLLGYKKHKGSWRLVAHQVTYPNEKPYIYSTIPIENAPRLVRIESLELLEKLVKALIEKIERFTAEIEKAKGRIDDNHQTPDRSTK